MTEVTEALLNVFHAVKSEQSLVCESLSAEFTHLIKTALEDKREKELTISPLLELLLRT